MDDNIDWVLYNRSVEYLKSNLEASVRENSRVNCEFNIRGIGRRDVDGENVCSVQIDAACTLTPEQVRDIENEVRDVLERRGLDDDAFVVSSDGRALGRFMVRVGKDISERV